MINLGAADRLTNQYVIFEEYDCSVHRKKSSLIDIATHNSVSYFIKTKVKIVLFSFIKYPCLLKTYQLKNVALINLTKKENDGVFITLEKQDNRMTTLQTLSKCQSRQYKAL